MSEVSGDWPEGKLPAIHGHAKEREPRDEDMDHSKPSSVCMGKKKAVEEGPRQETVGVVLGGAAMESLYY